jgi:hypothetical protein
VESEKMNKDIEKHKMYQRLIGRVANLREKWRDDVDIRVIDAIVAHGRYGYRMPLNIRDDFDKVEGEMLLLTGSGDTWDAFSNYAGYLGEAIRDIRQSRKRKQSYAPVEDALKNSRMQAISSLDGGFPKSSIQLTSKGDGDPLRLPVGLVVDEGRSRYSLINYVTIGATWWRSVGSKGFALINSTSGIRFVLTCVPRNVKYVDEDGMNAWEVRTVGFKHGKGFEENGWLVTHQSTDHNDLHPLYCYNERATMIPHAFSAHLSKAHSLMKNRTVRHLTKMLDA